MASTQPSSTGTQPADSSPRLPMPSKNPLPLSAAQEMQVRTTYYARVRGHCAKEIKAFAECAMGRTFTATFVCREQRLAMNTCMIAHDTPAEFDAAREDWFQQRLQRARERELKGTEAQQQPQRR